MLDALLSLVPADERIVIVEDSAELRPDHRHVVSLEGRPPNLEGAGAITLQTLVRQALRMRPDRLVVGEVRGAEVLDMLAAMNTGHEGGCATVHANAAAAVPARLEGLALAAGLARDAAAHQIGTAVQVVLHLDRVRAGPRVLAEVGVVEAEGAAVRVVSAVRFWAGGVEAGPGLDRLDELLAR